MRWLSCIFALLISSAAAQPPQRTSKPYVPVPITRPDASADAGFAAFRTELAAVAKGRVYASLAALVLKQGFFWDRDFVRRYDPRRPAVDNLAVAIALEADNGAGWDNLAAFAADGAVEPLDSRPGVICAPAHPNYDGVAYAKLLDKTYTDALDWAYPAADETAVRAAPRPDAPVVGTLGLAFVWLLGFDGPDSEPDPGRNLWARVGMPDGKAGYVAPRSLTALTRERLCYVNDPIAGWLIAGYIAGGH
jgi:hypothetical protein